MSILIFIAKAGLALALAGYIAVCGLLYLFQARFLFPGAFMPLPQGIEAEHRAYGLEPAKLTTPDGETLYLLHRAPHPGRAVVLLFHGNASYPEDYGFLYRGWIAAGHGIVAPVARGYPRSSGQPEGPEMLSDALAIRDWIALTYPGHPVVAFGQSLGTGPAIHVAANREVAGVILVAPFTSMLALVADRMSWIPARLLLSSPFRSDREIGAVKAPILIFHGDNDTLIPIEHGRTLASLAQAPAAFVAVSGAGHAKGLFQAPMIERITEFLREASP